MVRTIENELLPHKGSSPRVFLGSWDLYYAARKADWRFYKAFPRWRQPEFLEFISGMDLVIYRADEPDAPAEELMEKLGFDAVVINANPDAERANFGAGVESAVPYADYLVWRKMQRAEGAVGR